MRSIERLSFAVAIVVAGCGPSEAELAKYDPLVKDIVERSKEIANTMEQMNKELSSTNPIAAVETVKRLERMNKEVLAKSDEYRKLPPAVVRALDRKYQTELKQADVQLKAAEALANANALKIMR